MDTKAWVARGKESARTVQRRNSRRLARIVDEFEQDRARARAERERAASKGGDQARPAGEPDLVALAKKYKTDKWGRHWYAQHYHHHLEHLRHKPITLLEIGVGGYADPHSGGASLRMWKEFFPQGHIVGMDVYDKSPLQEDRIQILRGDQSDARSLEWVVQQIGRPIDVIVDDGSHIPSHVVTTFATLFPLLHPNGIYAVEDLQTSYWPEWQGSDDLNDPSTSMGMLKRLVDGLNYEEFVDDGYQPSYSDTHIVAAHFYHNLAILQKGDNVEGTRKRHILKRRYASA